MGGGQKVGTIAEDSAAKDVFENAGACLLSILQAT